MAEEQLDEVLQVKIPRRRVFIPELHYNPEKQSDITARTRLGKGVSLSKFLPAGGFKPSLDKLGSPAEKLALAKQYSMHANAMRMFMDTEKFGEHRLHVAEGYQEIDDTIDKNDSINYLKSTGQCVVYEIYDQKGQLDLFQSYELAYYWKVNLEYEKLILSYDHFNPNGSLWVQLLLVMPEIVAPWSVYYKNQIETRYNNYVQSTNEFVEVLE